jgi:hypothetical protein
VILISQSPRTHGNRRLVWVQAITGGMGFSGELVRAQAENNPLLYL